MGRGFFYWHDYMKQRIQLPIRRVPISYRPSVEALRFHESQARFRFLCWGVKSGKTPAGAAEFVRCVGALPKRMSWIVSPTYFNLQQAEENVVELLYGVKGLVMHNGYNRHSHDIYLSHGGKIQCRSADIPNNLRGPNVTGVLWLDECAFLKDDAWGICRQKVAASRAPIIGTTTPMGRNWFYNEVMKSGMPGDAPYGEWAQGDYYVSHYPTWQFPWVPKEEIESIKASQSSISFQKDYGALFLSENMEVFSHVEECFTMIRPGDEPDKIQSHYIIGYDPGQKQDPAGLVVMRAVDGRVMEVGRWEHMAWELQIAKVKEHSVRWGNATVMYDHANVGSVLEVMIRNAGIPAKPVDLNSPLVKNEIVQGLQVAFEQRRIKLPDFRCEWCPQNMKKLYDELKWFEPKITGGGKISYSAPKGLTDDLCIALCLCQHGRQMGAGSNDVISVIYDSSGNAWDDSDLEEGVTENEYKPIFKTKEQREEEAKKAEPRPLANVDKDMRQILHSKRPNIGKKIYGSRSIPAFSGMAGFWR